MAEDAKESGEPGPLIVGIGASAGGLDALSQMVSRLPAEAGVAIVIVQHMAPEHESMLAALLRQHSKLPVSQIEDGETVRSNRVYVNPPNAQVELHANVLRLVPRPFDASQHLAIDHFLRSLAEDAGPRAIGVILSGNGIDGASGMIEVKAAGGVTMAQEIGSARFDGMPRAAMATGAVDLVLTPDQIAAEIVRIAAHLPLAMPLRSSAGEREPDHVRDEHMHRIFAILRSATGVDFRHYKLPTIERRLQRRLMLHKLSRLDAYVRLLREKPEEVQALYRDILIHVTRFFREPESYAALSEQILPQIFEEERGDVPVRAWVVGCATGEEAYSLAISFVEYLGDRTGQLPIQIFATDVSEDAVATARAGLYPASIVSDVSPERLRRFFTKVDGAYRISKAVRDMCIFARQDITRDPPFSKLDLILCRNVLIYLNAPLQRKLLTVFHYALMNGRFLMLGHAETIGSHSDLFEFRDRRHRLYAKKAAELAGAEGFAVEPSALRVSPPRPPAVMRGETRSVQNEANRLLLDRYSPPGVVVDAELQITHFRGQTGPYLEPPPGDPSLNLFKMAREGLLHGLREAVETARRTARTARKEGLRIKQNGGWRTVNVEVIPLHAADKPHYLILFEPADGAPPLVLARQPEMPATDPEERVARLQEELAASRTYLQSIIQELEAANEELQSANEEILSSNEELQSTNEELDTAKEELQSTNEELNTVNEELHGRNEELTRVNGDLINILGSVRIAILIVSTDLRIRRFTPMAERVLNLIPGDVGRPIAHIKPNIQCDDLEQLIHEAIDSVSVIERQVQDRQGAWLSLRIRPYKSLDNRIDGAVLALFDIDELRRREDELEVTRSYVDAVLQTMRQPLVVLEPDLRIRLANPAFTKAFELDDEEIVGRHFYEIDGGAWQVPPVRSLLDDGSGSDGGAHEALVDHVFPRVGRRRVLLSRRRVPAPGAAPGVVLLELDVSSDHGEDGRA